MTQTYLMLLSAGLLMLAATQDLVSRVISNRISVAICSLGTLLRFVDGTLYVALLISLSVFLAAFVCWRFGLLGGGDVKLLAATALIMPPVAVPLFLVGVSLSGGILSLVFLGARNRTSVRPRSKPTGLLARAVRVERWRLNRGGPLPYAVAIAFGAFYAIFHERFGR